MRTSLNEIQHIEKHLLGDLPKEESLLLQAKMALDPDLNEKVTLQAETYAMVRAYGRKKLRTEIDRVEKKLFETSKYAGFRHRILSLFR